MNKYMLFKLLDDPLKFKRCLYDNDINLKDKKGRSTLSKMIFKNLIDLIDIALDNGAYIYEKDNYGKSPFDYTKEYKNKVSDKIIEYKKKIDVHGYGMLVNAIKNGVRSEYIISLIKNNLNDLGADVISLSIIKKRYDVFKSLLENNANPNVKTPYIKLPLFVAIENNLPEYLIDLIKYGANPYEKNDSDQTAFDFAEQLEIFSCSIILSKHKRYAIIDGVFKLCNDPNIKTYHIDEISIFDAIQSDSESCVKSLLLYGTDLTRVNSIGLTPLSFAKKYEKENMVTLIYDYLRNIDKIKKGIYPINYMTIYGDVFQLNSTIKNGADVNVFDSTDNTPLGHAYKHQKADCIKLLLESGASPNMGKVRHKLFRSNVIEILDSPFKAAIDNNDIRHVKLFLRYGAIVRRKGYDMSEYAESIGHFKCSKIMKKHMLHTKESIYSLRDIFESVHIKHFGNTTLLRKIIFDGTNLNVSNDNGITPLMKTVMDDMEEHIELMLTAGVDPDMQDDDGNTALYFAIYNDLKYTVKILLEYRANSNI